MAADPSEDAAEDDRTTVEQSPEENENEATANGALTTPAREPPPGNTAGRPTIDEQAWDDGTTVEEATVNASQPNDGFGAAEELTVDEPPKPAVLARLVVIAGNDTGREFVLAPGKPLSIGRAVENDVVLTDIAVSRKHLDLVWDNAWLLKDRGSGNGTLLNDRLEDNATRLQHGDRIEIGHTVFRFDHGGPAGVGPELGWGAGTQNDDEASTVAGRSPPRVATRPPAPTQPPTNKRPATGSSPPPLPVDRARAGLPPPRPGTPSQGGALSARLALPANPTAPMPSAEDTPMPGASEPSFLVSSGLVGGAPSMPSDSLSMRSMTATAHVEPLSYSSGSLPPVQAYVHLRPVGGSRRRPLVIGLAICAAVALIGVIAKLVDDDKPAVDAQALATSRDDSTPVVTPDPDPAPPEDVDDGAGSADDATADPQDDVVDPPEDDEQDPTPPITDPTPPVKDPTPPVKDPTPVKDVDPVKVKVAPPVKDKPKVVKDKPKVVKDKPKVVKDKPVKAGSAAAAKKKAQALYASKDFKGAAAMVREAAATAEDSEVAELKKLATNYDSLATSLAAGNAAAASKATDALAAYKRALKADKALGGTHAPMIREKLALVAPKAAAGFMAKGNYESAKQAADTAVNFGAGSSATVTQVRESLERKAGEFYASGQKLLATKPDDAKALFRRVLKIVPPDSGWYTKAYKALNARPVKKDDDE